MGEIQHQLKGNQYYILFVDGYLQYVTVQFLKTKTAATQSVRNYLTHLSTHEHMSKAIINMTASILHHKTVLWNT